MFCYNPVKYSVKGSVKGRIFIVSAPSGAGKTTLCKIACEKILKLVYSISYTTRVPREGEINGVDYYFISEEDFIRGIDKKKWVEWSKVHGNFYGTSSYFLEHHIKKGSHILLDLDTYGAECIIEKYSNAITIFLMPPSIEVLKERLFRRGTDDFLVIEERLRNAKLEIEKKNMYRYVIINDDLNLTVNKFLNIFKRNI